MGRAAGHRRALRPATHADARRAATTRSISAFTRSIRLSRDFWPFPADGVETDDATAPPLPGNAPGNWSDDKRRGRRRDHGAHQGARIARRLRTRRPADPARRRRREIRPRSQAVLRAHQGARTSPAPISSACAPIDGGKRRWMRVQVTDLTLTRGRGSRDRVRFVVTSLSTAQPVAGAADPARGPARR